MDNTVSADQRRSLRCLAMMIPASAEYELGSPSAARRQPLPGFGGNSHVPRTDRVI